MKDILVFGITVFSKKMFYHLLDSTDWRVAGFIVNKQYYDKSEFCGKKVFILETIKDNFDMSCTAILPSLGYSKMNQNRKGLFDYCHSNGYEIASYIDETIVNHAVSIGEGNIIMDHVRLDHDCQIGSGNIIWPDAVISHDVKIGDFNCIAERATFGGASVLGNYNFIGMAGIISNQIQIGDMNLIGAGAYVRQSLSKHMVVSPAEQRVVRANEKTLSWMLQSNNL